MKIKKIQKLKKINFNKKIKKIEFGKVYILSNFNNTIINITDNFGNTLVWSTSSMVGFKNLKKSSPYSAQLCAESAAKKVNLTYGLKFVNVIIKGAGAGRDLAIKGLVNAGCRIISICDCTPIPHNGCKPRKARRV